jgi:hypothetical protein
MLVATRSLLTHSLIAISSGFDAIYVKVGSLAHGDFFHFGLQPHNEIKSS